MRLQSVSVRYTFGPMGKAGNGKRGSPLTPGPSPKGSGGKRRRGWRTAGTSDPLELYEQSVQDPAGECSLIDQVWRERRGRKARSLREDFCGTAIVAAEWVKRRRDNTAVAIDLDGRVLEWGRARLRQRLNEEQRRRLTILRADVRTVKAAKVDCIVAMNFSYFIFKQREELKRYFEHCREGLARDGMLLLDAYGGSEAHLEMEEEQHFDGFTYVWDQALVNPITGRVVNHIHYTFPDGSRINKAFTYDWRLWTLPELRDVLLEAGFRNVAVYWEGTDRRTGQGNDVWRASERGEACEGWVAYLAAEK
jgi:hypothetical protein